MSVHAVAAVAGDRPRISDAGDPVLQRKCECGRHTGGGNCPECRKKSQMLQRKPVRHFPRANPRQNLPGDFSRVSPSPVQGAGPGTQIEIGHPGDRFEKEADRVADRVVSDRVPAKNTPMPITSVTRNDRVAEAASAPQVGALRSQPEAEHATTSAAASAIAGGGRPLSTEQRDFFESRFGRDFSFIRIHDDAKAGAAAEAIGARAYTLGAHIAFAPGQYKPHSQPGRRLLAHELTHTLQQDTRSNSIQRAESGGTAGGFFSNIGHFFSYLFTGSQSNIDDSELEAYLDNISELGTIEDDFDSDNKALAVVNRMEAGGDLFGHEDTVGLRKILIREMQSGATLGDEEEGILYLMTSLDALSIMQLFRGSNALDADELRSDIDGDNRTRLDNLLNAMGITASDLEARPNYEDCSQEERAAVAEAVRLSGRDLTLAISKLEDYLDESHDEEVDSDPVRNAIFLAFRVEDPTIGEVRALLDKIRAIREGARHVHYLCDHGESESSSCHDEARGHTSIGPGGEGVHICFMSDETDDTYNLGDESDDAQKSELITHEAAHFYLAVRDQGYFGDECAETDFASTCLRGTMENCGTSGRPSSERYDNADSYACVVFYLAHLAGEEAEEADEEGSLSSRARAYRGENLSIRMEYPDPLAASVLDEIGVSDPEGSELFVVVGEPESSGFRHHWSLEANGQTFELTPDSFQGESAAYVPEATKQELRRLQEGGQTHVEVILSTTPYRGAPESSRVERRLRAGLTETVRI